MTYFSLYTLINKAELNRLYLHKAVKGQCSQRCLSSVATSGREGSHISLMRASMCCMNSS